MQDRFLQALFLFPVFLFSLCVHEFSHALVASWRGDDTAKKAGRLTIHPLAHADLMGTFLLPLLCFFSGLPVFGWAVPVPVNISKLKNGRRDMALVALAGPFSNGVLALLSTGLLAGLLHSPGSWPVLTHLETLSLIGIQANLMLGLFNLLPVPPLDGFNVLQSVLPPSIASGIYRRSRAISLVLLGLILFGGLAWLGRLTQSLFRLLVSTVYPG